MTTITLALQLKFDCVASVGEYKCVTLLVVLEFCQALQLASDMKQLTLDTPSPIGGWSDLQDVNGVAIWTDASYINWILIENGLYLEKEPGMTKTGLSRNTLHLEVF